MLTGVIGPDATAERFASRWAARTGRAAVLRMAETVYELARVRPPARDARSAARGQRGRRDCSPRGRKLSIARRASTPSGTTSRFVRGKMAARQLFVWDNGAPVSMAAWGGRTEQGVRVSVRVHAPRRAEKRVRERGGGRA